MRRVCAKASSPPCAKPRSRSTLSAHFMASCPRAKNVPSSNCKVTRPSIRRRIAPRRAFSGSRRTQSRRTRRLRALVDRLQKQSPQGGRVDLLANQTIEDLKTLALDRLNPAPKAAPAAVTAASALVYLMCDQLDRANVAPMQDFLFDQSLEVRLPLFDGDSEQIREEHYETLKECDGVLIFWGKAKEGWLRTMLRDLNKVFGLGRTGPYKAASLYLAELPDVNKESFRTREVSTIRAGSEFDPDALRPFVAQLLRA